jgi:hypothetical protein
MRFIKNCAVAAGILAAVLLAGCGGGSSDGGGGGGGDNVSPTAVAGTPRTVDVGTTVFLNGSGSSDADGAVAGYAWTQTAGTAVSLSNANSAQPSFVAPQGVTAAALTFRLIVTDNRGATSAAASVTITVNGNAIPMANAGIPQTVAAGATVALNGLASSDSDGTIASYTWTQTSGIAAMLSSAVVAQPNFVAPSGTTAAVLTFSLVVTDNRGVASAAATVAITVTPNAAPVANIVATPQPATAGQQVTLSGTGSSDVDGTIAAYSWTQTAGPVTAVYNDTSPQAFIVVPLSAIGLTMTFRLVVTDNRGVTSAPAAVTVTVNPNTAPTPDAGPAQTVNSGSTVILNGGGSTDLEGGQLSFAWTQTAGPAVALDTGNPPRPRFVAPPVSVATILTFRLLVTDSLGAVSAPASVNITVNPAGTGLTTVTGTVRFARVPFRTSAPFGLDYANPVLQPSRGVTVVALSGSSGSQVIATGSTDANGFYSLGDIPVNTTVRIQVIARMVRDFTQPHPRWDIRVQNGEGGTGFQYSFTSGAFNSNLGLQNIDIPTGIAANGSATGVRASGPFAILDTIYSALASIVATGTSAEALAVTLIIDWGSQTDGTYFLVSNTLVTPHIKLLADLTEDTDEFDQHVVAHEFGHYIEYAYSRSDNIGGNHSLGDKLDMRVAFGEGFGYGFAAIVLNDPVVRDSYVQAGTQQVSSFSVETNPSGSAGCWCSESSVASILWDLYDSTPDGADNISLGFAPMWDVLVTAQKTTQSVTSIFQFVAALRAAQPASAILINSLVSAQGIDAAGLDAFATTQSSAPFPGMLPLFAPIVANGTPVIVRSIDDGGRHNKAGNHSFLRFTATATGNVRLTVFTSNPAANADPDFVVYRGSPDGISAGGGPLVFGTSGPPQPETLIFPVVLGKTYVIDAYDCANGCGSSLGTPGDYNLTVTLTTVP